MISIDAPTFLTLFFIFVVVCDVLVWKYYKLNNKFINYFLVFVMIFAHPIYHALTAFVLLLFDYYTYSVYRPRYLDIPVAILSMVVFAFLRYMVAKKFSPELNIFKFSKFYFFTLFFIPGFLLVKGEFNIAILLQVLLPILGGFSVVYALIKLLVIRYKPRYQQ